MTLIGKYSKNPFLTLLLNILQANGEKKFELTELLGEKGGAGGLRTKINRREK